MAITEQARNRLHDRLQQVLGADDAATLMEHLPPVGWRDVATTRDLDHLRASLGADIAGLRSEMKEADATLRAEIAGLRSELHEATATLAGDTSQLGTSLRAEIAGLRSELHEATATLAGDTSQLGTSLRAEIAGFRSELGLLHKDLELTLQTELRRFAWQVVAALGLAMSLAVAAPHF